MNIFYFLVVLMLLIESTIYAETTAKIRLLIRLFPIQYIKVNQSDTQTLKFSSENAFDVSHSHNLSTYSTSQFSLEIETITKKAFQKLSNMGAITTNSDHFIDRFVDGREMNDCCLVYGMVTL